MTTRFTQADASRASAPEFEFHASVCRSKARFVTKGKAKDHAKRMVRKHNRVSRLSAYLCRCCDGWHLTTVGK